MQVGWVKIGDFRPELITGRVHPRVRSDRVGSGHRNRENQWVGSGHVVVNLKICTFFHLTLKESLLLLILPQGDGIDKRHSATSRLRH